ncbi:hypothetical protein [Bernardetia sp.]|uniref:hypothetical protein n=1 Tax=Bernardetia sp. TaxID=1937974 RepID=UPI0025C0C5BD|nr:hypothetical protein [Bernardetia sp.]
MKKEKEKIRTQLIKSLEVYREKAGFYFLDLPTSNTPPINVELDNNDVEVLFLALGSSNQILLTTKCLFIIKNGEISRVDGLDIREFNFMNVESGRNKETRDKFETLREYKSWLYSGNFKITKTDCTDIVINLPHHDFGFCLFNAIKKLRFVTEKYEVF